MDINKFNEIFTNSELKDVLWSRRQDEKKIKEKELVENLFAVSDEQKEKFIKLFTDVLEHNRAQGIRKGTCEKLQKKFKEKAANLKWPLKETITKVMAASKRNVPSKVQAKANSSSSSSSSSSSIAADFQYDKFPGEVHKLADFKKRAAVLSEKKSEASGLIDEIVRRVNLDPLLNPQDSSVKPPFKWNKTGRDIEKVSVNANDVCLGKKRNYLLSGCPKTPQEAGDLYDAALKQGVSLFVATLESTEATSRMNNFWTKDKLAQIPLRFGWKIEYVGNHILAESAKEPNGTRTPQLIETCLIAKKEGEEDRILTHIHYDAWRDHHAAPNEGLLLTMLERIERIHEAEDVAFQINCKGGMGRTGTLAISHYIRRKIDEELKKGVSLDEIVLNVLEITYEFRKQRKGILSHGSQLAQVYSIAGSYHEQLKAKKIAV